MPTPEEQAREEIDRQLAACGWTVQDHKRMNISAAAGVAVREFPLKSGYADYLLYADGKAMGVVEAKPEGHTLTGVETQSSRYTFGLPEGVETWCRPLPFAYESTGAVTRFTNALEPDARSREVFTFHRPEELMRLAGLEVQLRANLRALPILDTRGLWRVQVQAIENLEKSLAAAKPRALIQMATGSGKTYTACSFCYRLVKFGRARRILFLVDRNNLGKQTLNEFQQYRAPGSGLKFSEEFVVQHLRHNTIDPAAKVCITTIQRLYSMLKGEEDYEEANEEASLFESASPLLRTPVPVAYNSKVPIETFDVIVIDECHRSIYNVWRQVLEYFDAFLIGLTATPSPQTIGFFDGNVVQDYSHEKAVADGVNVGYDVYRIATQIGQSGATLLKETGQFVPHRDRRTGKRRLAELEDDLTYTAGQLDRDVVAKDQIRLVIRTFRDRLFSEIFPGRKEVPKTLVFAKTDQHAEDIVEVIRQEFGRGNDFCQKITSKTTGRKPEDLLNEFRNSFNPRVAVTVDMIATGTDVKAIECLLFMRNIQSAAYFEQMKGRGVRVMNPEDLRGVTPDARHKTRFVVVDAVGVCENDKTVSKPLDRQPSVPLEKILQTAAQGVVHPDLVSALAARLARLAREADDYERQKPIAQASGGLSLGELVARLIDSLDADAAAEHAARKFNLAPDAEPTERQLDEAERERMAAALKPFHNPALRDAVLALKASLEQVIDEITRDQLVAAEFDGQAREKARSLVADFKAFVEKHKDEIEALKILYSRPYRAGLRYRQVRELAARLNTSPFFVDPKRPETVGRLWGAFEQAEPDKVKGKGGESLVDLVAMVRHAIEPAVPLVPVAAQVEERYRAWLAEQAKLEIAFTPEQRQWLDAIKDHIAAALRIEQEDFDGVPFNQRGGLGKVYQLFGERLPGLLDELNERLAA